MIHHKKFNDDYIPIDRSTSLEIIDYDSGNHSLLNIGTQQNISTKTSGSFASCLPAIEREMEKMRASPSALANYTRSLKIRFNLNSQINVIDKLAAYNNALSGGFNSSSILLKSKIELMNLQKEYLLAEQEIQDIDIEVAAEKQLRKLQKELESLTLQLKVEEKKMAIESLRAGGMKKTGQNAEKFEEYDPFE